jgi:hypothetical protein
MAYVPNSGSIVGFQSDPTKLLTHSSVSGTLNITGNPSISGQVGASIIGLTPVSIAGIPMVEIVGSVATSVTPVANQSVSGTVDIAGNPSISGTVNVGNNASVFALPVGSFITVSQSSSILAVPVGSTIVLVQGSVAAIVTNKPSISGTVEIGNTITINPVSVSGTIGASVIGHAPVVIVGGSILTSATANQSVSGTVDVGNFPENQSVSGSLNIVGNPSISGTVNISGNPSISGTVNIGIIPGSVAAWLQSTNASVITVGTPVANQSVSGTVGASVIGRVPVFLTDILSADNSSTDTLGASSVFTGTSEETLDYKAFTLNVFADKDSATDGFELQWSSDNTNWDHVETYTVSSLLGFSIQASPRARYFRTIYTNGTDAQGAFRLQTIKRLAEPTPKKTRVGEAPSLQDPGTLVQAVLTGETTAGGGGNLVNVKVNPSGTLQIGGTVSINPASVSGTVGASVIGHAPVVIVGGSILTSSTANQSVSGTVDIGNTVAVTLSGNPSISGTVIVAEIQGASVSGTVGASVIGHAPVVIVGGSILTSSTANQSVSGTVQSEQTGLRITSVISSTPSSMLVGASIIGLTPVTAVITGNPSISGTVLVGDTVAVTQSGDWTTSVVGNVGISGTPTFLQLAGSILATSATLTPTANQSVSGTVQAELLSTNASVITVGSPVANQSVSGTVNIAGNPSISGTVNIGTIPGSVVAFMGGAWATSLISGNASVITVWKDSSILAGQTGTRISSIVSTVPSSVIVGASIFGQLPAGTAPIGSVATLQGTNPWLVSFGNSSIVSIPTGSVITVLQGPSIVGTYAEDAAHAQSDKGVFVLAVRNDAMASISSADFDYTPIAVGPVGETITANSPITKWVRGATSVFYGGSVQVIAAQGASICTYITGLQLSNVGASSVLVTLYEGTGSIAGYTVAPQGGGSNIYYPNALKTRQNAAFSASISGVASVFLSAQGFIAKE